MGNFKNLLHQQYDHIRTLSITIPVLLLLCGLTGCGYPDVSPKTYEISKALYSACNRKSEEHVSKVSELIESHLESGDLSEREANWLRAIVRDAENGKWEAATLEARQLMEDQVHRSS